MKADLIDRSEKLSDRITSLSKKNYDWSRWSSRPIICLRPESNVLRTRVASLQTQDVESNVGITLVQRLRRWTNVKPTFIQHLLGWDDDPVLLIMYERPWIDVDGLRDSTVYHTKTNRGNCLLRK